MARRKTPVLAATPWDALLGKRPAKLPTTKSQRLVVAGKQLRKGQNLGDLALALEHDIGSVALTAAFLSKQRARAYYQERYQRVKDTPEEKARRKAWADAHKEERREYLRRWRRANSEKNRAYQADWARAKYQQDREAAARKQREWYAANREKVLARLRERNAARKAAKATTTTNPNDEGQKHEQG